MQNSNKIIKIISKKNPFLQRHKRTNMSNKKRKTEHFLKKQVSHHPEYRNAA